MSDFAARTLDDSARDAWQRLWERSHRHLALHWDWLNAAAGDIGLAPRRVGIWAGEELVAAAPFVERTRRLQCEWLNPAPLPFAGLLCARDAVSESFLRDSTSMLKGCVASAAKYAEVVLSPELEDGRGLAWNGWKLRPHYNYVSLIDGPESLAEQAEGNVRRQAEKARKAGMRLVEGAGYLDQILRLWTETRERQSLPDFIPEAVYSRVATLNIDGIPEAKVFAVLDDAGEARAGSIIVQDAARAYYALGASAAEAEGAPSLLHLESTRVLFESRGEFLYDWVGANTPNVAQFKKKFRPRLELYIRATFARGVARMWR